MKKVLLIFALVVPVLLAIAATAPLPVPVAEAFAARYQDYLFAEDEDWQDRHPTWEKLLVRLVDYKLRRDWSMYQARRVHQQGGADTAAQILYTVDSIRDVTITQRELGHEPLEQKNLPSLVRGYGYCESVNGALAMVLGQLQPDVQVYALFDPNTRKSPHVLVKTRSELGTVYADTWTDIPAMGFSSELSDKAAGAIPTYEDLRENTDTYKLYPPDNYTNGYVTYVHRTHNDWLYRLGLALKPLVAPATIPLGRWLLGGADRGEENRLRGTYLQARLNHLFDRKRRAESLYRRVVAAHCREVFCKAAKIYLARLQHAGLAGRPLSR